MVEDEWERWLPPNSAAHDWCPSSELGARWLQRLYKAPAQRHRGNCTSTRRVGGAGDGGKWLCIPPIAPRRCLVYSLGSSNSFAFELDVVRRLGCEVHTFDCTMRAAPSNLPRGVEFHDWCAGGADRGRYHTLRSMRKKLGHADRPLDVLKMDIERHEFAVVANLTAADLPTQLVFEGHLHNGYGAWGRPVLRREWLALWARLWSFNYTVFAFEPNPTCRCCCEFSLLRV